MLEFIIGEDLATGMPGTVRRHRLIFMKTPDGTVVAYQNEDVTSPIRNYTVVPGFFVRELPFREYESGARKIGVNPIPKNMRPEIFKMLIGLGYMEPVNFLKNSGYAYYSSILGDTSEDLKRR